MPKLYSLADRQKEFDAKFKLTGVTLKTYEGTLKPCVIHCEIHGDQTVSTYNNAFKSKYGCPKLFHEVHGDKYTYDMTRDEKYRITLFCPEHGASKLLPSHIANQKRGCPKCASVAAGQKRSKKSS